MTENGFRAFRPALLFVTGIQKRLRNPASIMPVVYFSGAVWTTIAFCELRQEIREFRLDRIKELKNQQAHFKPDKTFSMELYLEERSKRLFLNS